LIALVIDLRSLIQQALHKKEEGSSATDSVTDVTDVRKKEEAVIVMVSAIKNVLTV